MGIANIFIGWLNEPTKHYARDAGSVALPVCACQVP
jgi:hypothetical protein